MIYCCRNNINQQVPFITINVDDLDLGKAEAFMEYVNRRMTEGAF